jgi:hypothetical protein
MGRRRHEKRLVSKREGRRCRVVEESDFKADRRDIPDGSEGKSVGVGDGFVREAPL